MIIVFLIDFNITCDRSWYFDMMRVEKNWRSEVQIIPWHLGHDPEVRAAWNQDILDVSLHVTLW